MDKKRMLAKYVSEREIKNEDGNTQQSFSLDFKTKLPCLICMQDVCT